MLSDPLGDQVSRRGALTGGYVDNRKSRLDLYIAKQDLQQALEEKQQEIAVNKEQQQRLEVLEYIEQDACLQIPDFIQLFHC